MQELQLTVSPETAEKPEELNRVILRKTGYSKDDIRHIQLLKKSIDARSGKVKIHLKVKIYLKDDKVLKLNFKRDYKSVKNKPETIIIGTGPAGLFAALKLIEKGIKPILLERGKDVRSRRRDLAAINKKHIVNPDSNYCFGEGGAGTYSDGKLYTRSSKRGNVNKILETLIAHGAREDILINAHPHIGTNKLPGIITAIRESILEAGGEMHFNTTVTDFIIEENTIKGVLTRNGDKITGQSVILATGHSARDIFEMLHRKSISIQAKPFAMGVRVEHPQSLIDRIQYNCDPRGPYLPAASYQLRQQVNQRGVYSFCMCPGGFIVPAATAPGEIVVNGMSPSKRDSRYANSGIVVSIEPEDLQKYRQHGPLAGLRYQQEVEQAACAATGGTQTAPAQQMADFCNNKLSGTLSATSYQPGITSSPLHEVLPSPIARRLQEGLKAFGKKMKGYYTNEAVLLGVESRTSSPVRIPRDKVSLEHPQIKGLYPCGEGAGYAGGIVSAAIDGERCAEQAALRVKS